MSVWWVDGHLDLAYLAVTGRELREPNQDPAAGCISLPELRDANVRIAIGTIFTEAGAPESPAGYRDFGDLDGAERAGYRQLEWYERMEREGELRIVRSRRDLESKGKADDHLRVVILMEGADPIRSPDRVREWFDRGVRLVGLTWARGSRYAGGNAAHGSLTAAGMGLVAAFDTIGMIHDASHLADEALVNVLHRARGRIVATHSNCRALLDPENQRHLTDAHIRAIAQRSGVIGLNLYTRFLATDRRATIDDCVNHLEHLRSVTGRMDSIALGSDADGGFPASDLPEGLDHPSKWPSLLDALAARGWSKEMLDDFAHGNWLRFLYNTFTEHATGRDGAK